MTYDGNRDSATGISLTNAPENKSQSLLRSAATDPQREAWKSIRLEGVNTYPHRINPLSVLPDGRLYGTGEDYVGTFLFDPEYLDFVRGPDGFIWTYLKNILVRIDPRDAEVHVVGRIDPVGHLTFVGNDLYLAGPEQLRRIRKIAATP